MENLKEQATKNLLDFKKVLDDLGVVFWLEAGTLLGAYRDEDFCENDENDIDLGSYVRDMPLISLIIKEAKDIGFELYMFWPTQIAMKRGGCKIDLFFNTYDALKKTYWTILYKGNAIGEYLVVPESFYTDILRNELRFLGETFRVPNRVPEYLTLRYGDWKVKINRADYSCYNKDQNRLIVDKLF